MHAYHNDPCYNGPDLYDLDYKTIFILFKREGAATSVLTMIIMVKKMTIVIKNMIMVVLVILFKRVGTTTTAPTHTHRTRAAPLLRGILCTSSASPSSSSSSSSLSSSSSWFNYIMTVIFNNIILIITAAGAVDKSACMRLEWVCYSYGHSPLVICSSQPLPACLRIGFGRCHGDVFSYIELSFLVVRSQFIYSERLPSPYGLESAAFAVFRIAKPRMS